MRLRNLESRVFLALVLLTTAFFLWMVRGFLMPVFWAAIFAILFRPVFQRTARLVGGREGMAAALTTLTVVLVVIVPTGLLVAALAQQALWLYQRIRTGDVDVHAAVAWVERMLPRLTDLLAQYGIRAEQIRASVENAAIFVTQFVAAQTLAVGQNALTTAVMFGLMLYLLFFFFRDGDRIMRGIIRALPMGDEREIRLFSKFAQVSRATVKGTLVVAVVQGALGGVLFALVGIQAAIFWAVVMGILSLLPAVGAGLVWAPAAIILLATGSIWQGVVVILGGTFVIGLIDNLLRPILIGRETQMPDYLILLATLGGLSVFGLAGFVAGPIIAALFLVMWEMFADEYAPLDSSEPPAAPTAIPDAVLAEAPPPSYEPAAGPMRPEVGSGSLQERSS
jgi:predicted PurR-regulated permease PerM